jgi:hypothetical protein
MSLIRAVLALFKKVAGAIWNLLPVAPSPEGPPPDIDGRRQDDLDPEALLRVQLERKDGHGGYR